MYYTELVRTFSRYRIDLSISAAVPRTQFTSLTTSVTKHCPLTQPHTPYVHYKQYIHITLPLWYSLHKTTHRVLLIKVALHTHNDWGVCSWPWQLFTPGENRPSLTCGQQHLYSFTDIFGWGAVVYFAFEIIKLFTALFCAIKTLQKNKRKNAQKTRRPTEWSSCNHGDSSWENSLLTTRGHGTHYKQH